MNLIMMTDVQTKQLENLAEPLNMVGFTSKKHGECYQKKETWRILLSGHGGPFGFCRKKQKTQNVITNMC